MSVPAEVQLNMPPTDPADTEMTVEEGPRMRKLREVFEAALNTCLNGCSYAKMAQAFPRLARDNPDALRSAREQLVAFIRESIREEFEDINMDKNVVAKLNELDRIIALAQQRQKAEYERGQGRGSKRTDNSSAPAECMHFRVSPAQAIRAYSVYAKRRELSKLHTELAEIQSANHALQSRLTQSRAEVSTLQNTIQSSADKLLPPRGIVDVIEINTAVGGSEMEWT
ncbi:uncharacterized protein SPPG_03261 [Spizellomyces punctatus DAOM BR117]|uniref:Uncharacterized protein n=1 Tax=Spizellomyces punctatus (strain DAOM BR117) TaxID=645134 RepID=A0A0L0HKU3_SPIPD|nr:uncharacterized protein SPPG_03261 [Spizellomyces punctatus DAOM BR117]KND01459.1 hypothetical protein SPPG_03261 [Spizellomyces punctatus DAOM BR117]|eukprot:XP_016609498.1 hypothetical protein SPPG_03261 [Spizellomyces punctatus DAOM BR117]